MANPIQLIKLAGPASRLMVPGGACWKDIVTVLTTLIPAATPLAEAINAVSAEAAASGRPLSLLDLATDDRVAPLLVKIQSGGEQCVRAAVCPHCDQPFALARFSEHPDSPDNA